MFGADEQVLGRGAKRLRSGSANERRYRQSCDPARSKHLLGTAGAVNRRFR